VIRNLPFVTIAGSGMFTAAVPTGLLCVDASSPLKVPKELEGKQISVPSLNSMTTLAIQAWLAQNKADPNSVRFIELPFPEVTAALNRGTVAAGYIGEPLLESALKTTARRFGNPYAVFGRQVLVSNWVTTRDWLTKNHELAKRFVTTMYDVARWSNKNHDLTAPILAKYSKIDLDRIKTMNRVIYATGFDAKMLQPTLDAAYDFKVLSRRVTMDELVAKL
jgi:NitT/TauT family transport system substrate-binding protein